MSLPGPLLNLRLSVDYSNRPGVLRHAALQIERSEIIGLMGESGSGKSTLALAILKLLRYRGGSATGEIHFKGRDLMRLSEREMRQVRGREIALVLQSPMSALNPALKIGTQLSEAWRAHGGPPRNGCVSRLLDLLKSVSLPAEESFLRRYPQELSVGQAQRLLITMAILHGPALLVADEPTSALDVITQSEILQLFARLNRELNMAILFISHDLVSTASLCRRIAILHRGEIIEFGKTEQVFRNPVHAYTRRLIEALPKNPFL